MKLILVSIVILAAFIPKASLAAIDSDNDGLTDDQEQVYYTNSTNPDTDGDGYLDGEEVSAGFSPLAASSTRMHEYDYDKDGLNDWLEGWFRTDRGKIDTDADGFLDYDEVMFGYDPTDPAPSLKFNRKIVVDRTFQRLYYLVDNVKLLNLPVSTGNPYSQTPAGSFTIQRMLPVKRYTGPGYDLAGVKWNMQFQPMYYIHGAYWHNDFGKRTHSHGCVNLSDKDAELLYSYVQVGLPVDIVGITPKGFAVGT